uniref:DNA replication complex GINS protein PSF3 n=1 Tax=Caligus rogercresseyi TaxID=217165 RepID=C1BQD2_CALRO|nr:DNA replication complex GINS protein PSF3 [Caligus rogercresseyi]
MSSSYLDLHDILATSYRIPVKTSSSLKSLGFLDPSSGLEDLPENFKVEMPLWMVFPLLRHGLGPDFPKSYSSGHREILEADPSVVDLHKAGPYFYENGIYLLSKFGGHPDAERLGKILPEVLRRRFRMIMDSSQHAEEGDALTQKAMLDALERELFSAGQESKRQVSAWFKRKTGQIHTADMVSRHCKRKASLE